LRVDHVEVLVEEPSAEALLSVLLPTVLRDRTFCIHVYQGKRDLLRKLPSRLRAYAKWLPSSCRILVMVDRDDDNCMRLKERLERAALQAGLATRSSPKGAEYRVVNRLVIEELEAWYFGDWQAVCRAYPRLPAIPALKYRSPDEISGGTWEALERLMQRQKYFLAGLRKMEAARTIAPYMDPSRNSSPSFNVFYKALLEIAAT
jgi:hypothetical protein